MITSKLYPLSSNKVIYPFGYHSKYCVFPISRIEFEWRKL